LRDGRHFRQSLGQLTENKQDVSLSSEDEEVSWNTPSKRLVCHASSHQGDSDKLLYHYPGQQCAGIAFTSLLYSTIHPVGSWTESDLDKLLIVGDKTPLLPSLPPEIQDWYNPTLHVEELPTKLRAFRYEFHVDTEIFGGRS